MTRAGVIALGAGALVVAGALVLAAAAPASRGASPSYQPIQGAWSFEGGTVLIQPVSRHRFVGIVVRKTTFGTCTHPRGQRMWRISGSGRSYTGTHLYFKKSLPCAVDRPGQATWVVGGTRTHQTLRFCSAEPGTGPPVPSNPTTLCHTLPRVAVPGIVGRTCFPLAGKLTLCVSGPIQLRRIGCLPRVRTPAEFTVTLGGAGAASAQARVGPFHLGTRRLRQQSQTVGQGQRVRVATPGSRFAPGPHLLSAVARTGGRRHTLKKTVWICD